MAELRTWGEGLFLMSEVPLYPPPGMRAYTNLWHTVLCYRVTCLY